MNTFFKVPEKAKKENIMSAKNTEDLKYLLREVFVFAQTETVDKLYRGVPLSKKIEILSELDDPEESIKCILSNFYSE